jgi:phage terminase large subunit GpA-like protein
MMKSGKYYRTLQISGAALRPLPDIKVSDWADQYRQLPPGSVEPGQWSMGRTPYLKEIHDVLTPSDPTKKVIVMKPSQSGGTEVGLNWLGYIVHLNPAPILAVFPTVDVAQKWSKQKLTPTIEATPTIRNLYFPDKAKDSNNTILLKNFRGGYLAMVGANSPSGLRMLTTKYLYGEEISAYDASAGIEGDPLRLAEARCNNFFDRKIYYVSSPSVRNFCRIEYEYLHSDQRQYYVPCPHCGEFQVLTWHQLKFNSKDPTDEIYYECEKCKGKIYEYHKTEMLAHGFWKKENPDSDVAGFWWNGLYNPIGWKSWRDAVTEWIDAQQDTNLLKVFVNTYLAETWQDQRDEIDENKLLNNREIYEAQIPDGVFVVCAGVDVQANRLELGVWGFGYHFETWLIDHAIFEGDTSTIDPYEQLDEYLKTEYQNKNGNIFNITAIGFDTGFRTLEVYQFCRTRETRRLSPTAVQRIYPVKGGGSKQTVSKPSRDNQGKVNLYSLHVDNIKDSIFGKINVKRLHLNIEIADEEYCAQLCAEVVHTVRNKGFARREYMQIRERNEALDTCVYAHAACYILSPAFQVLQKKLKLNQEQEMPGNVQTQPEPIQPVQVTQIPQILPPKKPQRPPKRGGWDVMGGTRW